MKKKMIIFAIIIVIFSFGIYNVFKSIPSGTNYQSSPIYLEEKDIDFIFDLTYLDKNKEKISEQQIFSNIFSAIENANQYILLDFFLFNSYLAKESSSYSNLAQELTQNLINKKAKNPNIKIDFITDPINSVYGGSENKQIKELKDNGINIIETNLLVLRDSNPLYSSFWRTFFQWFGNSKKFQWVKHPFSNIDGKVSFRSYLTMLNFKANHRKVFLADSQEEMIGIITSANPHNGSSAHSNVAWIFKGNLCKEIYLAESRIAHFSNRKLEELPKFDEKKIEKKYTATLLTEKAIKDKILEKINLTQEGDEISIAMFYLSDKDIVSALKKASEKKIEIRIILDPNKDAFGYKKNGIPNRPVANILKRDTQDKIKIRWYDTNGEQFHTKLIFINTKKDFFAFLGSANLTRRNLENYNLEMDIMLEGEKNSRLAEKIITYFNLLWENKNNQTYTAEYEKYKDQSILKEIIYKLQESSGISSF